VRASMTKYLMRRLAGRVAMALLAAAFVGMSAPAAWAADTLTLTSSYPGVVVTPGSHISFQINVKTSPAARVDLSLSGVPAGWTASLQGGGFVINAVQTNGTDPVAVKLDVGVPDNASGTTHLVLTGTALGRTATLGLDVTAQTVAGGDVQITTDVPSVQGSSSSSFSFNLSIHNNTPGDLTFSVNATGPDGWTVTAKLNTSTQAASAVVTSGAVSGVTVSANPPSGVAAGSYPIQFVATAGDKQYTQALTVNITGSYDMSMTTPTQVLSNHGTAGTATEQQIVISNDGTAPITNVKVASVPPTNWTIHFDNDTIDSIAAGQSATVTATITPSSDAITGDYSISFSVTNDQSTTANLALRFTVETSIVGAVIGVGLIALVFVGLWWVFRRYGRR
jgi:uncharacterized membrane protein